MKGSLSSLFTNLTTHTRPWRQHSNAEDLTMQNMQPFRRCRNWKTTWQTDPSSYHQPLESCSELCWITGFWYRGQNISKQENTNVRNSGLNPIARKRFNNKEQQSNHDEFSHVLLWKNDNLVACWREPTGTSSLSPFHFIFLQYYQLYYSRCTFHPHDLFICNWKFASLKPLYLFAHPPTQSKDSAGVTYSSPASPRANILHLCGAMVSTHEPAMMHCY